jgi:hypothetical protein
MKHQDGWKSNKELRREGDKYAKKLKEGRTYFGSHF